MTRTACLSSLIRLSWIASAALVSFAAAADAPPALQGAAGIDQAALDTSVRPGDDFFAYANGGWIRRTEIPADRSSYGNFQIVDDLTYKRTAELIRAAGQGAAPGSVAEKIGRYYAAYLDEAAIEKLGAAPISAGLKRIDGIKDRTQLAGALGATLRTDVDVLNNTNLHTENLFGLWVAQDLSDPTRYAAFLLQGGLVMPDRDYYLNPSQHMAEVRTRYQAHIEKVLQLGGIADAHGAAARVYALEQRIAAAHVSREESEDVLRGNNHWSLADFGQRAPGMDWTAFFEAAGLGAQHEFVVWQPSALSGIAALVGGEPLESWKAFLRFHYIESSSPYLAKRFVDEHFEFHEHVLSGTPQQPPRWKSAVAETNTALGMAVGQLYVAKYFPASEKARAEAMVKNLLAAFAARIDRLDWMAPQTRAEAKAKLAVLKVGVGYPDHWRSYEGLRVTAGDAFGNAERADLFEYRRNLAKFGQPVDRSEWVMNPQLVNAVNLPAMNALNIPAAILQPPYFDPTRDPAMDYGGTGGTLGHEISHSFDDQGAQFDSQGRLRNWWTEQDYAHFKAAGAALVAQFDAYHPFPDVSVNGKQTLSENIADVAGLSAAFDAWQASRIPGSVPPGGAFSLEQLFFISYAQSWQTKMREAAARRRLVTDGHAPAEYRADTVRNLDPWYQAFDVQPGEKLYLTPAQRVRVW
ncbi:MAG: M13 family metallopeptidase [Proteobacteria bacterium]|nr:M13 family metallopeptidase [Pseudomonadota bacterium]